jgi:IS4 transposase
VFTAKQEGVLSLEDLCRELQKDGTKIRKQSLQERFNEPAANFMKQMVEHALSKKLGLDKDRIACQFGRIVINDSTVFQLPEEYADKYKGFGGGASKAGIKNQYCFDLLSQEIIDITVQEGTTPDCTYPLQDLRANDLRIEDLGYFKVDKFRVIEQAEAYFLSRLKFGVNIFVLEKGKYQRLDLLAVIGKMKGAEIKNIQVYLGEKEKHPTRLILEKVPEQLANEKRRKLQTDKQNKRKGTSKERLIFCNVNAFITNCTQEQLPNDLLRECYSLRWQVEIIFKAWKSFFKIDKVKQMKVERFECFHYGCLMLIIASTHLLRYFKQWYLNKHKEEVSELKFFKLIASMKQEIKEAIKKQKSAIADFLDQLAFIIERTCVKEQKRYKLKPLSIIRNLT